MALNQKVSYSSVQQAIANLRKNKVEDVSAIVMYVLNPQLTSFNYDIYDFNKTTVDFQTGNIDIVVDENIKMLISLDDMIADGSIYTTDDYKIYIYFSYDDLTYDLYFKVLDNWELVEHVDFKIAEDEKDMDAKMKRETDKFSRFSRYVTSNVINQEHKKKGEKYFTEAVLDRYLEKQEFNNEFIRVALLNEFRKPSVELITMLASALGKEFTTMPQEQVQERLKPLIEKGLYEAVESLVNGDNGYTTSGNKQTHRMSGEDFSYLKKQTVEPKQDVKKEEPKKEEPKKEEPKQDVNKQEPKKETPKQEVKKDEPKKEGLDKLKDLGINVDKKPVQGDILEKNITESGGVNLDDLF